MKINETQRTAFDVSKSFSFLHVCCFNVFFFPYSHRFRNSRPAHRGVGAGRRHCFELLGRDGLRRAGDHQGPQQKGRRAQKHRRVAGVELVGPHEGLAR